MLHALPTTPEWYLILAVLGVVVCWAAVWPPLVWVVPLVAIAASISAAQSVGSAVRAYRGPVRRGRGEMVKLWGLTAWMHLMQPAARLLGKVRQGLTPWRRRGPGGVVVPMRRSLELWDENWRSLEDRLHDIETKLEHNEAVVVRGGDFDDWDLEVRGGLVGSVRARMTVEEHGRGWQMVRLRAWPRVSANAGLLTLLLIFICDAAAIMQAWHTWAVSLAVLLVTLGVLLRELGAAMAAIRHVTPEWSAHGRKKIRDGGKA
jgi:hypothetical protein